MNKVNAIIIGLGILMTTASAAYAGQCGSVWTGKIERLRIYNQPESTGQKVFAYVYPGSNQFYIGYSDNDSLTKALFLARDGMREVTGYTNASCRIEWLDY